MADSGPGSAEHPLGFWPLWRRTLTVIRGQRELLWPLAGAFFFLPQLLISIFMPDRSLEARLEGSPLLSIVLIAALLLTILGQLVVAFIAVHDGTDGLSLRQVIRRAIRLLGPAVVLLLIQGMAALVFLLPLLSPGLPPAAKLGAILVMAVPGLLVFARLAIAMPLLATQTRSPIEALKTSWRMANGVTLRILVSLTTLLAGLLLFYAGIVSFAILLSAPDVLSANIGQWSISRWVVELLSALAVAAMGIVSMVFYSSLLTVLQTTGGNKA